MSGRGAYLHERQGCWEKGLQGALAKALKTDLSAEDKERLTDFLAALSEEASAHQTECDEQFWGIPGKYNFGQRVENPELNT